MIPEEAQTRHHRLTDDLEFYLAGKEGSGRAPARLAEFHERSRQIWRETKNAWISQCPATGAPG